MKFETAFRNYQLEFRQLCTTIMGYTLKSLFEWGVSFLFKGCLLREILAEKRRYKHTFPKAIKL